MNLIINGHHMVVTESLREAVLKKLRRFKDRLTGAMKVKVLFAGKKKNGWSPSIQIQVSLKGKVIMVKEYLCREYNLHPQDFYDVVTRAIDVLGQRLEQYISKVSKSFKQARRLSYYQKHGQLSKYMMSH